MKKKLSHLGTDFLAHFPANLFSTLASKERMTQHIIQLLMKHKEEQLGTGFNDVFSMKMQTEGSMFPYAPKLLICELLATEEQKQWRNLISPLLNKTHDAPQYGIFHTGTNMRCLTFKHYCLVLYYWNGMIMSFAFLANQQLRLLLLH